MMEQIQQLLLILISSALVSNVVLSQFLGLCPFLGVSKKVETAAGMGTAVICHYAFFRCGGSNLQIYSDAFEHPVSADDRIYPRHCGAGAVRRNVPQKIYEIAV